MTISLKKLWHGAQIIGFGPSIRTAVYPLRLAWYRARYGFDASDKAFTRSIPQAIRHLFINKNAPDTTVKSIGAVTATKRLPNGIELQCTNGLCTIEAVTSRIMRVRVVREGPMPALFFLCHDPRPARRSPRNPGRGQRSGDFDAGCALPRASLALRSAHDGC